jgi:hypothetical protein
MCVDEAFKPQNLRHGGPPPSMADCTTIRDEKTAEGRVRETKCGRGSVTIHTLMTAKSSATHFESHISTDWVDAGGRTVQHAEGGGIMDWVGPCPAGMKADQIEFQPPLSSGVVRPADVEAPPSAKTIAASDLQWARRPSEADMAMYYPARGRELAKSASIQIRCELQLDGTLGACALQAEAPAGYGFGDASRRIARLFQVQMTADLQAQVRGGGLAVTVPMTWTLPR